MAHADTHVDVSKLAEIALAGTHSGLKARLRQIEFNWTTDGIKAEGTFCYLAFRDGQLTQDDFVEFVYYNIVPFCLPRAQVRSFFDKYAAARDERIFHEAADAAKELFIKAKNKNPKSGEPGEVVLFSLLEGILKAPRLVAKMRLKTNPNMEVYGSDAIHMKYQPDDESLTIYWGEAKLYGQLSNALDEIATSIKSFREYSSERKGAQREFDIDLIQAHPDLDTPDVAATRDALLAYFDPYTEHSNKVREIHACLAMWDWSFCKTLNELDPDKAEDLFKRKYRERIESACSLFIEKIKTQGLDKFRFHFFLIPLADVKDFRRRFCNKVGLPFNEDSGGN